MLVLFEARATHIINKKTACKRCLFASRCFIVVNVWCAWLLLGDGELLAYAEGVALEAVGALDGADGGAVFLGYGAECLAGADGVAALAALGFVAAFGGFGGDGEFLAGLQAVVAEAVDLHQLVDAHAVLGGYLGQ